jgi:hypothetical protein
MPRLARAVSGQIDSLGRRPPSCCPRHHRVGHRSRDIEHPAPHAAESLISSNVEQSLRSGDHCTPRGALAAGDGSPVSCCRGQALVSQCPALPRLPARTAAGQPPCLHTGLTPATAIHPARATRRAGSTAATTRLPGFAVPRPSPALDQPCKAQRWALPEGARCHAAACCWSGHACTWRHCYLSAVLTLCHRPSQRW